MDALAYGLGPPPFVFRTSQPALPGPAFSHAFKILATAVVFACAASLAQAWLSSRAAGAAAGGGWFIAGLLLMLYTWWHILKSETRIDDTGLYQSWMWDKHLELRELAYCKMIRVKGLDWLIAPRLYARTLTGKFAVFYAASPKMISEFERLAKELKDFRSAR